MLTTFRARPLVPRTCATATASASAATATCAATCTAATTRRRCGRPARDRLLLTSLEQAAIVLELLELGLELSEEHLGESGGEGGVCVAVGGREVQRGKLGDVGGREGREGA